ncbi:MAG: hypothetical protein KDJ52_02475 [Anaerolineae bacterium]|nr:hypothetical protein [Anaerolineae bacterium]
MQPQLNSAKTNLVNRISDARQKVRSSEISFWIWAVPLIFVVSIAVIITLRKQREVVTEPLDVRFEPPKPAIDSVTVATSRVSTPVAESVTISTQPDNLKKIKGIGPKIEKLLNDHGITTFLQIAEMKADEIQALLDTVDWTDFANPTTWPEQAKEFVETQKKM